jgi:hypothetical protein
MTELRKLIKQDILDIRDNLIEPGQREWLTDKAAQHAHGSEMSYTYMKDGVIVGCCGGDRFKGVWQMWAMYAKGFSAMTIARCAKAFIAKRKELLDGEPSEFGVLASCTELVRYAKFLGGLFVRTEKGLLDGKIYNVYEVI